MVLTLSKSPATEALSSSVELGFTLFQNFTILLFDHDLIDDGECFMTQIVFENKTIEVFHVRVMTEVFEGR